jgi:hypothetical protein
MKIGTPPRWPLVPSEKRIRWSWGFVSVEATTDATHVTACLGERRLA